MVRHGASSAGSYLADATSPIPSHCAVIILLKYCPRVSTVMTSTLKVNILERCLVSARTFSVKHDMISYTLTNKTEHKCAHVVLKSSQGCATTLVWNNFTCLKAYIYLLSQTYNRPCQVFSPGLLRSLAHSVRLSSILILFFTSRVIRHCLGNVTCVSCDVHSTSKQHW